jgi:hypothetical protein
MKKKDAIDYFGGVKNLADALGIWPAAIYQWGEYVPELQGYKIQVITKNKLKQETTNNANK